MEHGYLCHPMDMWCVCVCNVFTSCPCKIARTVLCAWTLFCCRFCIHGLSLMLSLLDPGMPCVKDLFQLFLISTSSGQKGSLSVLHVCHLVLHHLPLLYLLKYEIYSVNQILVLHVARPSQGIFYFLDGRYSLIQCL